MRGVKVWLVRVGDGNGDTLDLYGPFLSQQAVEDWIKPRKAIFPDLEYELELVTPIDLKWKHPLDCPYEGPESPICEDCGEPLKAVDYDQFWSQNGPLDDYPRCCNDCAEKLE
jgi:hypothetical protein